MNSLARNCLLMARRVVEWFTSANDSVPSSSSALPQDQIRNSSTWKSLLHTFNYYTQASPAAVSLAKRSTKKARKRARKEAEKLVKNETKKPAKRKTKKCAEKKTIAKIERKEIARCRAKMVETEVPIAKDVIDVIQKRVEEMCGFKDVDRIGVFKKYDYVVIIDASLARSGRSAAVAIVLSNDKLEPEVRIFLGDSVTSSEAEQIPILHFLQYKRALIVTDQKSLVSKWKSHRKRKGLDKVVLAELDENPGNRLMYIPSKQLGLYRICDILSRFVAGLNSGKERENKHKIRSICNELRNMKVDDTFRLLSKKP